MPLPDLSLYIPVVCETDSKYAGKCFMEKISAVRTLNGESVLKGSTLKKSDFKTGDVVTVRFQNKDFRGTVDFSRDEEVLKERGESPCSSTANLGNPAKASPARSRVSAVPRDSEQRKRHRSGDGLTTSAHEGKSEAKRAKCSPKTVTAKAKGVSTVGKRPRAPGVILAGCSHHPADSVPQVPGGELPLADRSYQYPTVTQACHIGVPSAGCSHLPVSTTALTMASGDMQPLLVEARLENILKLNELNRTIENAYAKMMQTMLEVKSDVLALKDDVLALKRRQDLLFKKQDIIHSTLAGEVPREFTYSKSGVGSFCSPSVTPSVVAWSPPFPSSQLQRQPQVTLPLETHLPGYSTPVDVDSFSDEEIQSFLSLDLEGGRRKRMKSKPVDNPFALSDLFSAYPPAGTPPSSLPLLPPAETPQLPSLQTQLLAETPPLSSQLPARTPLPSFVHTSPPAGTLLPSSPQTQLLAETLPPSSQLPARTQLPSFVQTSPPAGTPLSSSQSRPPTSVRILLSELGLFVPEQTGYSPSAEADQSHVCTARNGSSMSTMQDLSRNSPIPKGDLPADVVINAFMVKNDNILDVNNVGRLAVLLARYTFFGDGVLQESTLKGKGKRPGLDPRIIDSLISTIHNRHPFSLMSITDFRKKIRPKIERSLTDFLKPKSKKV